MSSSVFALQVSPNLPPSLQRLDDLSKNFWFSWNPALDQLFRKLDPVLWRKVEGSPRLFLRTCGCCCSMALRLSDHHSSEGP